VRSCAPAADEHLNASCHFVSASDPPLRRYAGARMDRRYAYTFLLTAAVGGCIYPGYYDSGDRTDCETMAGIGWRTAGVATTARPTPTRYRRWRPRPRRDRLPGRTRLPRRTPRSTPRRPVTPRQTFASRERSTPVTRTPGIRPSCETGARPELSTHTGVGRCGECLLPGRRRSRTCRHRAGGR
jgi:hypothetical protein